MSILIYIIFFFIMAPLFLLRAYLKFKKNHSSDKDKKKWGIFHPFCNDGGGGQKVLWCIVKAISQNSNNQIAIFSLQSDKQKIIKQVKSRFQINLEAQRIKIIHVSGKWCLTAKGFLTMVMHLILPMIYGFKCLWKYQPDILYDTTGYASVLCLSKLILPSAQTSAYIHYPFISHDMIEKVKAKKTDFNNNQLISKSPFLSKAKIYYYKTILYIYKHIGSCVDFAQTNSSWTHNHMSHLWSQLDKNNKLVKVYPPCTVQKLIKIEKTIKLQKIIIMSLAQFRPQKQQFLQIQVLNQLIKINPKKQILLKICGTTRNSDDQLILSNLKKLAYQTYKIPQSNLQFVVNQPYSVIQKCLAESLIGIHTMQAEHFGISVVQMLAAGLIVVAHNSAGPKQDIICDIDYLASTPQDYTTKINSIISMNISDFEQKSNQNRKKSLKFNERQFQLNFLKATGGKKNQ